MGDETCFGSRGIGVGLATGRRFGSATTGGGAFTITSGEFDFRSRISMRLRSGRSAGVPSIARVSSVFTNWAPERGISL
jgi:hypothetical protein